jgi:NAD(P)-dependent dehydrogenase (short-subunit alcohol dehydrogenase family)
MILIAGGSGLIGKAIGDSFLTKHLVYNYDLVHSDNPRHIFFDAHEPLTAHLSRNACNIETFIDCARYKSQADQITTWEAVISYFKKRNREHGQMILFSSIYGHKAPRFGMYEGTDVPETPLSYAMDKAAVEQATKFLAEKYKKWKIAVNCIAPGGVFNGHSEDFQEHYMTAGGVPMIQTKNLLPVVKMLMDDDNVINGQIISVEGGWTL